jgi:uncharacterized protein YndB with AHSA1/START domain
MSIEPIVKTVAVKAAPAKAFEIFTTRMGDWWAVGTTISKTPHVAIAIEPKVGGRWYERDASGAETQWGKVLAWDPPRRLLLAWQINSKMKFDPDLMTELELRFEASGKGGALVRLEHRNLERYGADAAGFVAMMTEGWAHKLKEFADYSAA